MSTTQATKGTGTNAKKAAASATLASTAPAKKNPFWDTTYRRDYCKGVNGWTFKEFSDSADDDELLSSSVKTRSIKLNPLWESTYRRDYCGGCECSTAPVGTRLMTRSLDAAEDDKEANKNVWQTTYQIDFCSRFAKPKRRL
ncbi:hypothetical protein TVAG_374200 [Trichomonas vaginalis G3]|uniref:Uncharacterized protein n=1 Tax=Trichomonas vaginalis (strain ATCC PRA-98 / G3) TaxID=412133 RepID=A2EBV1_TRIV3|nr:hypothetical protein TVAGG3_0463920 [Trichomonas vaginalis G3]EAY09913.1 hypothetical protein TVAG_374200 [Trichomonas vaginalis G3]KAI5514630.1 hypothetical protein TVAGG3_0463920 [Trichomonas vaginalis G3]|eukprot:XP_001322136.1 hypothetical protein [Trichomonas vaginalis G3]